MNSLPIPPDLDYPASQAAWETRLGALRAIIATTPYGQMQESRSQYSEGYGSPRTYKPLRQRTRRFATDFKNQSARQALKEEFERDLNRDPGESATASMPDNPWDSLVERSTLCLPSFTEDAILHAGDHGFKDLVRKYFPSTESNASERLVNLKARLRAASTHDFWAILMEEMCDITGSQCGFVAKRMLVDDQNSAVEMPELGEPGSCLMGVAFYVNNGSDVKELHRDYRYLAYGTPCAHMKNDKVFIIPERLTEVIPNNPNTMPWEQSEAFIGVPLFHEGKCFAHFGMMWSSEGASSRKLGWSFIEMFLHSLEDMILQRILEGRGFAKDAPEPESTPAKVIPLSAITASQSLKPYARSMSHELRTPMQGVVGMLDIMYSTVLDAIANQPSEKIRSVFKELQTNIEVVQESSRRAVEAADNVVHAYDLDMRMPDTPLSPNEIDLDIMSPKSAAISSCISSPARKPRTFSTPKSRKHPRSDESDFRTGPAEKRLLNGPNKADIIRIYRPGEKDFSPMSVQALSVDDDLDIPIIELEVGSEPETQIATRNPNHRRLLTRELMCRALHEALRADHPLKQQHTPTELGETIEVTTLSSRGEVQERKVYLEIARDVPEVIVVEEQHLQFSLQKVVDNAVKFTEGGSIKLTVKLGRNGQVIEIWVVDTGCGIAEESRANLFRPHFQEDASISRSRDGLGLSLFNAKAHIRKNLGGDVTLERSATEGPSRGSEFLIRLPISALEVDNTAVVGNTPPATSHQPCRRHHLYDGMSTPIVNLKTSRSGTASPPNGNTPRASPSISVSRSRTRFNNNLAKDYPLNILVVEDNPINRNVALGSLNKLGYSNNTVKVAFDGLEAVKIYESSLSKPINERFNAILMDVWMPNMDGYEATTKILELASRAGHATTVLAVTADITGESVEKTKEVGMSGFLAKPFRVHDLEKLIIEHFEKRVPKEGEQEVR